MTAPLVLLLEPHFVLRRTVATAAAQLGLARVHEAATLAAALKLAQAQTYDLFVLALDAFDGEPHAVAEAVRRVNAHRAIGLAPEGAAEVAHGAGLDAVLSKPVRAKELLRHLAVGIASEPVARFA